MIVFGFGLDPNLNLVSIEEKEKKKSVIRRIILFSASLLFFSLIIRMNDSLDQYIEFFQPGGGFKEETKKIKSQWIVIGTSMIQNNHNNYAYIHPRVKIHGHSSVTWIDLGVTCNILR